MSIKVSSLSKLYDTQKAVDNISFELKKGEIVGFLGPNGAGKSTTMKIITGYLPASGGKAEVCGFDVAEKPMEVRSRVGYLPEANPLYYDMYVREYLEFTAGIHKLGKGAKQRIEEMIEMTGLSKEAHKKIGALSKGYKQRVGLAQAMLHDPEVLILDEPTTGLDPNQILEIRDLIRKIGAEKTVLLSTHIMQEVQAMCSRVIIINNGQIVADDSIENLREAGAQQDVMMVSFDKAVDAKLLKQLKNVASAESVGDNKWKLVSKSAEELPRELMQWALDQHVNITSMQAEVNSLEDVFRKLTK
ncbi:gliding motility-associated ABC transporter ATP-binding subunit GldA [Flavipsychrobacter stenotrophus]|uniref:Gliding motility-associated ABC transporter ATP-binding subunit GldA n=1 Tax=Flavipsychrobacter stenotrophus TaxID=2077091 RepID=A0A2S7SXZ6_9BACT|nr:gliding motility-associated ABC transporter ATP-binding subunit GldA [Flavipsychrobacter stenotrophus]PQJ11465.1 gliding motility-associated ABC transporter ATP-binding subunit GldA [Flavipsychrobacter stenotrophus]